MSASRPPACAASLLFAAACASEPATQGTAGSSNGNSSGGSTTTTTSTGTLDPDTSAGDTSGSSTTAAHGSSSDGGSSSTGVVDDSCMVSGQLGTCEDVIDCASLSLLAICDGAPSNQCCLPDATACSVEGAPGLCLPTASCPDGLARTPGLCPGDADVQCCTDPALACDPDAMPLPNEGLEEQSYDAACPDGMITVVDVCVDRFEASLVVIDDGGAPISSWSPYVHPSGVNVRAVSLTGAVPQGYIDGDTAASACAAAGKRLCTDAEWLRACRGPQDTTYPWGDAAMPGVCNDARATHPAIEYFGTAEAWIWSELDNPCILQVPDGLQTTGAHPGCVTAEGAVDMVGNLHEWTADPAGTFRGGFFVDTVLNGPGCSYATVAHDRSHWDYSTGFRCCADPT